MVEGNIASGKSTLLNHFSKKSYAEVKLVWLELISGDGCVGLKVLFEPVEKWQTIGGGNLLVIEIR